VSDSCLKSLIAELASLPYAELRDRYQVVFRSSVQPRLSQDLLKRALAYRIQAEHLGGLPRKTEKLLQADTTPRLRNARCQLEPGSQLVREWQGQMHVVDVLEDGFRWKEKSFDSLSAVARAITGTRWSGPRFFGLSRNGST